MSDVDPGWRAELFARRTMGVRPGLANIAAVDEVLGHPCGDVPMVHVVGTNGKGSTSTMIAALLHADGEGPVGLYTSPHLHRVGERVRVDGVAISDARVQRWVQEVVDAEARCGKRLSFFEVLTMVALLEFRAAGVRAMVLEAGLGGRLDATRLRRSRVVVCTSIDLDHQEFLGETLPEIAQEKAAVIHGGARVVVAPQAPEVHAVLDAVAEREECSLDIAGPCKRPPRGLPGLHQRVNAGLAVAAVGAWRGTPRGVDEDLQILDDVRMLGRFEAIRRGSTTAVFDVAHNPAGLRALARTSRDRLGLPDTVLVGWSPNRPAPDMLHACPGGRMMGWVPVMPGDPTPAGPWTRVFGGPQDPEIAPWIRNNGPFALVCGSHQVVGPIRAEWAGVSAVDDPTLTDPTR